MPEDAIVIGNVGGLHKQKNHTFFLEVAANIARMHPQAHFVIVGEGHLRKELENKTRDLGLEKRVVFAGGRNDVPQLMINLFDVLLFPSLWEGMPLVLVEAAAAGLPIISTPVGVALELVTSGETGFIVPADPDTICDRLLQLSDPKTRAEFSQNLRQRARQLFGWNNVMERYLDLYRSL